MPAIEYRRALPEDALCIGVLATQVFLDTYATEGVRADLAREVLTVCSGEAFALRLATASRRFTLAEQTASLVGFAEMDFRSACPVDSTHGVVLVRLYVQPSFQRKGIGRELLRRAEREAAAGGSGSLWLSAWSGNNRALAFYAGAGYKDIGSTAHVIEGREYENRVLVKTLKQIEPREGT